MRFSLVVATVGRVSELERFLDSVAAQYYPDLEVLVADQNDDDRLSEISAALGGAVEIRRIRARRGVSRARNTALRVITGDVIAFPDDDCVYPPGLLHSVARALSGDAGLGGVVGCPVDPDTGKRFRGFAAEPTDLTKRNVWQLSSSIGLFLRSDVVRRVGNFDESLGLGAGTPWGAGEDRDYPLRALDLGIRLRYDPTIKIHHRSSTYADAERAHLFGGGLGRVLRKRSAGKAEVVRLLLLRPLGGLLLALVRGRFPAARFYASSLRGRVSGWRAPIA